jgi:predicted ABC-type ATPase
VSTKRRNPADDVKAVIVFAGPNGSGKSSITRSYLANPENGFSGAYVNADDIAVGMTRQIPDARERNIAAAQEAERQRLALLKTGKSFVFETVMSTPEKVALLSQAREQGYSVTLVFVTTCDPDINVSRVADRVAKGGHDVDSSAVHSRYESAMKLLPVAIEQADSVVVLDNSRDGESAQVVAMKHDRGALEIMKGPLTPPWAFERLENDFKARLESLAELASALQSEGHKGAPPVKLAQAADGLSYTGRMAAVTALHLLQEEQDKRFLVHARALVQDRPFRAGLVQTVSYAYERGKIVSLEPDRIKPDKPDRDRNR